MLSNVQNLSLHIVNDRLIVGGVATIIRLIRQTILTEKATFTLWVDETHGCLEPEPRRLAWGLRGWRKWLTLVSSPVPYRLIYAILRDRRKGLFPVVHLNTPYISTALAAIVASVVTRVPLIYTVHANRTHISKFYWLFENFIYRCSDKFVLELSVSRIDYKKKNQEQIRFIPFGVLRVNTSKKWHPRSIRPFKFIAVNRMENNRMVDVFIRAFAGQMSDNDSVLYLVGDGAHKADLVALANQLGCGERILFFPGIEEVKIQDVLITCDCFLTLTASGEVGMAGKLAAGVGIPCLAYEFDQLAETNYTATSDKQLSRKMASLAQAKDDKLENHAKETTSALYSSSDDMLSAYLTIYREVA